MRVSKRRGDWKDKVFQALCENVNKIKGNITIACSSGYDSRILLKALLATGKIFKAVECGGESVQFKQICDVLKIEGTSKHPHNFKFDPGRFNGIVGYPLNQWWDAYDNPTNLVTGYGANEITKCLQLTNGSTWVKLNKYFEWHYYHALNRFAAKGKDVMPFWSDEFLAAIASYTGWMNKKVRLSETLSKYVAPELNHIKKMKTEDVIALGFRTIDDETVTKLANEYANTWFGERFPHVVNRNIEYNSWWGHWNASQLCEYLLKKGHKIIS